MNFIYLSIFHIILIFAWLPLVTPYALCADFKPNDVLVIVEQSEGVGNSWEWTIHPTNFYDLPTRWMGE